MAAIPAASDGEIARRTGRPAAQRGSRLIDGNRARVAIPLVAVVGLVLVAVATLTFWNDPLALGVPGKGGAGASLGVAGRTAVPSNVVVTNPNASLAGSVVYAKAGNLWLQTGTETKQLTTTGHDSMPAWSSDGTWVYFIEERTTQGQWPPEAPSTYTLNYEVLVRIHPDGTGRTDILSSLISRGGNLKYFYWLREPAISPDGKTVAVISDGPNPDAQDTMLQFVDVATGKLLPAPNLTETAPLGHTSPAYKRDGTEIAFVMEGRSATGGAEPSIWVYDVAKRTARALTDAGYRSPSWSPDGKYLTATHDAGGKLDVVILDASTGKEITRVTADGASSEPVWSPAGGSIIYLRTTGGVADLRVAEIDTTSGSVKVGKDLPVTDNSGIDSASRPAWYIPAG